MECPTCKFNLHPNMRNSLIGKNKRNVSIFIFYQICPECEEPIVGIKESILGELYMNPNEEKGLIFLTRQRNKEQ